MNEKIFKTLGQIGAAGIIVGIITTIVGITDFSRSCFDDEIISKRAFKLFRCFEVFRIGNGSGKKIWF